MLLPLTELPEPLPTVPTRDLWPHQPATKVRTELPQQAMFRSLVINLINTLFSGWVDQLPPASEDLTRPAGGLQDPGWRQNEGHCGQLPTPPASEWKKCQLLELKIVNDDVICTNFNSMLLYISLNIITILSISIEFVNPTPWSRIISGWSPHIIPSLSFKAFFGRCNWPDASNPDITLA